jgi:hypothetical protein
MGMGPSAPTSHKQKEKALGEGRRWSCGLREVL